MLARFRRSMEEKDQGFTLIELLIVIVIIGILAAIAIPIFLNQRQKGIQAGQRADAKAIATQVETFYTEGSAYPTSTQASRTGNTVTIGTASVFLSGNNTAELWVDGSKFCVEVANADSGGFTAVYQSDKGGLVTTGDCSTGYGTAALFT